MSTMCDDLGRGLIDVGLGFDDPDDLGLLVRIGIGGGRDRDFFSICIFLTDESVLG